MKKIPETVSTLLNFLSSNVLIEISIKTNAAPAQVESINNFGGLNASKVTYGAITKQVSTKELKLIH